MKSINDKYQQLQKRLNELKETLADDVHASFKEAEQTQSSIALYEIMLKQMEANKDCDSKIHFVVRIRDGRGGEIIVRIVASSPDPNKYIFTINSPIAQTLMNSRVGDPLKICGKKYIIAEIQQFDEGHNAN